MDSIDPAERNQNTPNLSPAVEMNSGASFTQKWSQPPILLQVENSNRSYEKAPQHCFVVGICL